MPDKLGREVGVAERVVVVRVAHGLDDLGGLLVLPPRPAGLVILVARVSPLVLALLLALAHANVRAQSSKFIRQNCGRRPHKIRTVSFFKRVNFVSYNTQELALLNLKRYGNRGQLV